MTGASRVTARVDLDPRIGLGHFRRVRTLLVELARRGHGVRIVGRAGLSTTAVPLLGDLPWVILETGEDSSETLDAERTLAGIGPADGESSWIVVDHYGIGELWERTLREAGHRLLAIDDLRDRRHCAEILVSDTAAAFGPDLDHCPGGALQLVGPQFALLDPEFAPAVEPQNPPEGGLRLLITYGGGDPTGETLKALEAIRRARGRANFIGELGAVDVVIGPANERREDIVRQALEIEAVTVHFSPPSLAPLMRATTFVVTAAGNSVAEALAIGRPCLVTETAANQGLMLGFLVAEGAVVSLGGHQDVSPESILEGISTLFAGRKGLATRLRERPIFDTRGASRIAQALESRALGRPDLSSGARRPTPAECS